tara:strand:+ start:12990 stop:13544 length:555 start_codon:yes stop_codon:yes gene_type:complete
MSRSVHADVITALQSDQIRMAHIVTMYFDSTLFVTNYAVDLVYGGQTYSAINGFLSASSPTETKDLRVNSMNLVMSGADQSFISIFLNQNWVNRRVQVRKVLLNANTSVIGTPITLFDGTISQFEINESGSDSEVVISIASHWADFNKKAGRLTNNNSQQFFFDGDLGFDFAANSVQQIKWGKS